MSMNERDPYRAAADGVEMRRRVSTVAGIPMTATARTPDPLPNMSTALDGLHAARRDAGMPDFDEDDGIAHGVRLARLARDEITAAIDRR